ncbi:TetR family transcriptional regulator [Nocardia panacis]|uniref:TetR family transcriptional regulator n=1 Tax=Nocardia panacis TaxID=2340916 RepID=A0A3A4K8B1_9NOCA|nr:TetR family transcriptional regulator [Nocardia panacis]RJO70917.1 TetR family transcriptional regulator [Nocardia panacis]
MSAATSKGERRRGAILDIAEGILLESGHGELTMRAVAAAGNIRLGHLQYYFPNRADLVGAVLRRALDRSLQRLTPLLTEAESDGGAKDLVRLLLAEHDICSMRLYSELWALASRDETVAAAVREFYRAYQEQVAQVVRARRPELSADACAARARVFTAVLEGASLFRTGIAAEADAGSDAVLIDLAARLFDPA